MYWIAGVDIYCTPGPDSSSAIKPEKRTRHSIPMCFALHDKNKRFHQSEMLDILKLVSSLLEKLNK